MAQGPIAGLASLDVLDPDSTLGELPPAAQRSRRPAHKAWQIHRSSRRDSSIATTENRREQDLLSEKLKQIPKIKRKMLEPRLSPRNTTVCEAAQPIGRHS